jgi:hypothetical protein
MKLLDLITDLHNWISDKDFIWWPFSFLRPEKHEAMTMKLVFQMAGCFSLLGTLMFTAFAIVNNIFSASSMFQTLVLTFVLFFTWFALITRTFWNRRAYRLSAPKLRN